MNYQQLFMVETQSGWVPAEKRLVLDSPVVVSSYREMLVPYIDPRLQQPQYLSQPQQKQLSSFDLAWLDKPTSQEELYWLTNQITYVLSTAGSFSFLFQDYCGNTPLHIAMDRLNIPLLEKIFTALTQEQKKIALSTASHMPLGVISGETCLSDGDTIIHVALKRLDLLLLQENSTEELISLLAKLLPYADIHALNFSTSKEPDEIFTAAEFFKKYLAAQEACAPLHCYLSPTKQSPDSSVSDNTTGLTTSACDSLTTADSKEESTTQSVESDTPCINSSFEVLTDDAAKLSIATLVTREQKTIDSKVSHQKKVQNASCRLSSSDCRKKPSHLINKIFDSSAEQKPKFAPSIKQGGTTKKPTIKKPIIPKTINEEIIEKVPQEVVTAIPVAAKTSNDSIEVDSIVMTKATKENPLDDIFSAIAKKKLKPLQTVLTKHKKALKTAGPWRNTAGKTLLYCALEENFITAIDVLIGLLPTLVTQSNADGSLPIDYVLEHADNHTMHCLFFDWLIGKKCIDLNSINTAGRSLQSRAEDAGFLQTSSATCKTNNTKHLPELSKKAATGKLQMANTQFSPPSSKPDDTLPIETALNLNMPEFLSISMNHPERAEEALDCILKNPGNPKLEHLLATQPTLLIELAEKINLRLIPSLTTVNAYHLIEDMQDRGVLTTKLLLEKESDNRDGHNALVIALEDYLTAQDEKMATQSLENKNAFINKLLSWATLEEWSTNSSTADKVFILNAITTLCTKL